MFNDFSIRINRNYLSHLPNAKYSIYFVINQPNLFWIRKTHLRIFQNIFSFTLNYHKASFLRCAYWLRKISNPNLNLVPLRFSLRLASWRLRTNYLLVGLGIFAINGIPLHSKEIDRLLVASQIDKKNSVLLKKWIQSLKE